MDVILNTCSSLGCTSNQTVSVQYFLRITIWEIAHACSQKLYESNPANYYLICLPSMISKEMVTMLSNGTYHSVKVLPGIFGSRLHHSLGSTWTKRLNFRGEMRVTDLGTKAAVDQMQQCDWWSWSLSCKKSPMAAFPPHTRWLWLWASIILVLKQFSGQCSEPKHFQLFQQWFSFH